MSVRPFHLTRPRSVAEAVGVLARDPGAAAIAGGTDLITLARDGIAAPSRLVDLGGLGLDRIEWRPDGTVRIGALCRNAVDDARLRAEFPVITEALRSGASPQIRNMATFGGNLLQRVRCPYFRQPEFACNRRAPGSGCAAADGDGSRQAIFGASPACIAVHPSDLAVALRAMDAVVLVAGPSGSRRIPLDELHLLPGDTPHRETSLGRAEVITAIEIPPRPFGRRSHYLKFRDRASFAFALVSAAVAVELQGGVVRSARIALGGVAAKPWRGPAAEAALTGRRFAAAAIAAAADAAVAGAAPRPDNAYKVELVRRVVRRALSELEQR
ncbi:FAD binding domain-containing protein [Amycolatopsis anabasis]|uniref:FAD binding domain-containing protein n=1 Tax=Amycolatopsis anabasis TaxID=1840409 RepID=UPI00131AD6C6|nr:xanthine dehydrogenase family protein subunit M [Amycolatopsis anabasis]